MKRMLDIAGDRMDSVAGSSGVEKADLPAEQQWFRAAPLREALNALNVDPGLEQRVSLCYGLYREDGDIGNPEEDWTFDIVLPVAHQPGDAVPQAILRGSVICSSILHQKQICLAEQEDETISQVCLVPATGDVPVEDRKDGSPAALTATGWWPCWTFVMQAAEGRGIDEWFPRAADAVEHLLRGRRAHSATSLGLFVMKRGREHWDSQDDDWRKTSPPISGFSARLSESSSAQTGTITKCVVSIGAHPSYDQRFWTAVAGDLDARVTRMRGRAFEVIVPT